MVALVVDYEKFHHHTEAVENATSIEQNDDASVINVDANFLIPEEERSQDSAFPRLRQMLEMVEAAEAAGAQPAAAPRDTAAANSRPYRRPDFDAEWKLLKRCWSLHQSGKDGISAKLLKNGSDTFYADDPLANVEDWVWRFCLFVSGRAYARHFNTVIEEAKKGVLDPDYDRLMAYYDAQVLLSRRNKVFRLIDEYFGAFDEFSQVHFRVISATPIPEGLMAGSVDFKKTRMFYGNAYEVLGSSVDIIAFLNNIINGRKFDEFEKLSLKQFLELDKSSRFGPFANNAPFSELFLEKDNSLRNASHHGSFDIDRSSQLIQFRAGKGGAGEERSMLYGDYLVKCCRIFLQILTLYRVELILRHGANRKLPV